MREADRNHLRMIGALILSEANDLKRTPAALANELGLPLSTLETVIAGDADLTTAHAVLRAISDRYPVSLADLWLDSDDTTQGVRIMRSSESAATARVFERPDRTGAPKPYYEYRDTAMSRLAPFKPEWISQIRVVNDSDPCNPDVAFNNGHFLFQTTFFVGPVNFYWEIGGERRCAEMDTGDSNFIAPFVPHSFTSRDPRRRGLIIAVTYSGEVRRSLSEFARIGADAAADLAGDLRDPAGSLRTRIYRQMAAEMLDLDGLAARADEYGLAPERTRSIVADGDGTPDEIAAIAKALNISIHHLAVAPMEREDAVVVRRFAETPVRTYPSGNAPAYRVTEMARSPLQPNLKGFAVLVTSTGAPIRHGLYEYVFNYGDAPVQFYWEGKHTDTLGPGDSACVLPMCEHGFARLEGEDDGRLIVIRVPGALSDAALDEYASFDPDHRHRVTRETLRWF